MTQQNHAPRLNPSDETILWLAASCQRVSRSSATS